MLFPHAFIRLGLLFKSLLPELHLTAQTEGRSFFVNAAISLKREDFKFPEDLAAVFAAQARPDQLPPQLHEPSTLGNEAIYAIHWTKEHFEVVNKPHLEDED